VTSESIDNGFGIQETSNQKEHLIYGALSVGSV